MKKFRVKKQTNKITGSERWIVQYYGGFPYGWEQFLGYTFSTEEAAKNKCYGLNVKNAWV